MLEYSGGEDVIRDPDLLNLSKKKKKSVLNTNYEYETERFLEDFLTSFPPFVEMKYYFKVTRTV